ncbi:MAG TPA: hypothetical protein V6C76_05990 [Drouetiella sp.]
MTKVFQNAFKNRMHSRSRRLGIVAVVAALVACSGGTTAEAQPTSADIKVNRSTNMLKGSVKTVADAIWEQVGTDVIKLDSGELLINPLNTLRVNTAHGDVYVHKNCAVLASAEPKISRFLVLFDSWSGGVTVTTEKRTKKVISGSEFDVIEASNQNTATQELVQDGLRRRHVKFFDEGSNRFIATAQFSIPDAMVKQQVLSSLQSSTDKSDRNMFEHLIKVAAAISITGSPEPYTTHE